MLLRGQVRTKQLEFDIEMEKTAERNRSRRRRERQNQKQSEEVHVPIITTTDSIEEEFIMAKGVENPPRRTLGDYSMQQGP